MDAFWDGFEKVAKKYTKKEMAAGDEKFESSSWHKRYTPEISGAITGLGAAALSAKLSKGKGALRGAAAGGAAGGLGYLSGLIGGINLMPRDMQSARVRRNMKSMGLKDHE